MKIRLMILALLLVQTAPATAWDWAGLWLSPDQQAQRMLERGEFQSAASKFTQAEHIGAALYLAGDFKSATAVLGRSSSPEAHYNRGNAHVMLGEYDAAIQAYRSALTRRPDWLEAQQNMQIAVARKRALAPPDDDSGGTGGMLGADEIVFDQQGRTNNSSGEQVIDAADQQLGEAAMRAIWLRKVDTRPADFLAARFNHQLAIREPPRAESPSVDGNE